MIKALQDQQKLIVDLQARIEDRRDLARNVSTGAYIKLSKNVRNIPQTWIITDNYTVI